MKQNDWFKDKVIKLKNKNFLNRCFYIFIFIILKISIRSSKVKNKKENLKIIINRSIKKLSSREFTFIPAGFAFYLFISIIPILIISFSIINPFFINKETLHFSNTKDFLLEEILNRYIPGIGKSIPETLNIFSSAAWETTTWIILLFSSLWISSSGYAKFIESQSIIYIHKNSGNIIFNRIKGIFIVIIISLILSFFLILSTFLFIELQIKFKNKLWVYELCFYTISIFLVFIFFYIIWLILLKISPVFKITFKQISSGVFISSLSSVLFSAIFGFLSSAKFISYDKFGTLATFLYLSTFCFYISYLLYFGVIINEAFYKTFFSEFTRHKYKFQKKKNFN